MAAASSISRTPSCAQYPSEGMRRASRWNSGIQSSCTGPKCTPRTTIVPPGATISPQRARLSEASRRLDHDVVDPPGADLRPEAFPGLLLVPVARLQGDVLGAEAVGPRHGQEAERARADDGDPGPGPGAGQPKRMPRHGRGLDDGRRRGGRARRGSAPAAPRGARNCSAIPPSAPMPSARCPCVGQRLYVPAGTLLARHAAVDRLDHHRGAVRPVPGELVTQHVPAAEPDVAEVRGADAGRLHGEHLAPVPGGVVEIDHRDAALLTPDRLHDGSGAGGGSACSPTVFSTAAMHR